MMQTLPVLRALGHRDRHLVRALARRRRVGRRTPRPEAHASAPCRPPCSRRPDVPGGRRRVGSSPAGRSRVARRRPRGRRRQVLRVDRRVRHRVAVAARPRPHLEQPGRHQRLPPVHGLRGQPEHRLRRPSPSRRRRRRHGAAVLARRLQPVLQRYGAARSRRCPCGGRSSAPRSAASASSSRRSPDTCRPSPAPSAGRCRRPPRPSAPTWTPVVQPYVGSPPTTGSAFTTRTAPMSWLASSFASSWPSAFSTGAAAGLLRGPPRSPASAPGRVRRVIACVHAVACGPGTACRCRRPAYRAGTSRCPAPACSPASTGPGAVLVRARPARLPCATRRPGDAEGLRQPGHLGLGDLARVR